MKSNQTGSVAVVVALILTLLLGVMAFSMDTGYLYLKKNQYQNAVEVAALSAVQRLCDDDWETIAGNIVYQNGIDTNSGSLIVETGFYDSRDEYGNDLGDFKDFGPPPSGEYENAVHIRWEESTASLSGMNEKVTVVAEAVAYLQRIDMVSLDSRGAIRIGHNSTWDNVTFFSNGDIKYPQGATAEGETYSPPEFNDCDLLNTGDVYSCPVEVTPFGWFDELMIIQWDSGSAQSEAYIQTGLDPIAEIRPVDDDYLDYWRDQADIVYTPDQAGQDNIYYGQATSSYPGGLNYFVDPASAGGGRRVIFFDAGDDAEGSVVLGPHSYNGTVPHTPNGYTIAGLTFVATCSIHVANLPSGATNQPELHIGGEGDEQTMIISAKDITIHPGRGSNTIFNGTFFRTGGDFLKDQLSSSETLYIRVVADGDICGTNYDLYDHDDIGMFDCEVHSRFGPPCPPAMARLGKLEAVEE
jgi:hypothetical protein